MEAGDDAADIDNSLRDGEIHNEPEMMEDTYVPPHVMTALEDLKMAFDDHAIGFEMVLDDILCHYEYDEKKEKMLFSEEGIEASLAGLSKLKKVIEKYEEIVLSRS